MEWKISSELVPYADALAFMEARVAAIRAGDAPECVWLLEHPPLYTAGTSAKMEDLVDADQFPVFETGRGGQYTYHGPGQRVAYIMLDLKKRSDAPDIRKFVKQLERLIIQTLAEFDIDGFAAEGRIGVWVQDGSREAKIAALGIRVRHWVTFHGISINVNPDLSHFNGIIPCGISPETHGVTSFHAEGKRVTMEQLDAALKAQFGEVFGG